MHIYLTSVSILELHSAATHVLAAFYCRFKSCNITTPQCGQSDKKKSIKSPKRGVSNVFCSQPPGVLTTAPVRKYEKHSDT